jgi:hypothetical protein
MDTDLLTRKFEALGARVKFAPAAADRFRSGLPSPVSLDIRRDDKGEYFDLRIDDRQVEGLDAIDVRPRDRHLLLLAWVRPFEGSVRRGGDWRNPWGIQPPRAQKIQKPRFLCGHDERHWFVAAIPEAAHASTVRTAMEALKPLAVRRAEADVRLPFTHRFTRKNKAFVRQGEWFFLPADVAVPAADVRRNEPLQRSGGKAHWAEFAYRTGGEQVYVSDKFPRGLIGAKFAAYIARHPGARGEFRVMIRNAAVYVRGRVSHPDHATITLNGWHFVVMNTEHEAVARRNVVFLD